MKVRPAPHQDLFLANLFAFFLVAVVIAFVELIGVVQFLVLSGSVSDYFVIGNLFLVFVPSLVWHSAS